MSVQDDLHSPLTRVRLLAQLREILWPDGDTDHQWSPDTIDEIAHAMIAEGYGPERE